MTPGERSELLDSLLDDDISEADFLKIEAELSVDAEVRREYYRRLQLNLLLEREATESSCEQAADDQAPRVEKNRSDVGKNRMTWLVGVMLAIAAVLLVAVTLDTFSFRHGDDVPVVAATSSDEPSASGFAVLSGQSDAVWEDAAIGSGSLVPEGNMHLKSGLIHLELFSGVQVVIQGEAIFSVDSPMQISMNRGRARAQVPTAAQGFLIKTAAGEVVDLGTEFAVEVTEERSSVQVVDGEVELRPRGSESIRLLQGDSREVIADGQVSQQGTQDLNMVGPVDFQRELAKTQSNRFERWREASNAMRQDPRLIAHYQVDPHEIWSSQITNLASGRQQIASDGAVVAAERTADRWGRSGGALDFSRMGSRVRVEASGKYRGLTLLCWVKINSLDRWYNSLFLTDGHEDHEPHWQIMEDGRMFFSVKVPTSRLKQRGDSQQPVFFSKPFWDTSLSGRWIMLATVYDVDQKRVAHYVDGEEISSETIADELLVDSIEIGAASICNWSQPMYRTDAKFVVRNLNGVLDEFALFAGALTPERIREIYKVGDPD